MPPAGARRPGWGSLPEDLVCAVAALLPVRDRCAPRGSRAGLPRASLHARLAHLPHAPRRYGALPLLNRHFHAISQRWPIQCGVFQLAQPSTRLMEQVSWPMCEAYHHC